MHKGIELHKSGKVEVAAQLYSVVLKEQPDHPDANHNMGVLAVGIGKIQEALPFFETALEANADVAQFWVSYIDTLMRVGRIGDAQAVFDQAKNNGAEGDGFDQLEQRLNEVGQAQSEADTASSKVHSRQSNILDTLKLDQALRLAKKTAKEHSVEEAKRIYQDILVKFPKNKRAMDGLKGFAGERFSEVSKVQDPPHYQQQLLADLYNEGKLQETLDRVAELLQKFPNSTKLFNIQGASNAGLGLLDAAIESYNKALALEPDYADVYYNMGNALKEKGQLEKAIAAYNKALALNPNYVDAYNNMGNALRGQGEFEEAIEAFNKALAITSDYPGGHGNIGNVLADQGKLEEAIEYYNKALLLKPNSEEIICNIGVTSEAQGKLEEAIEAYNKALVINPDYADAHLSLGFALLKSGELKRGLDEYEWRWNSTKFMSSNRHFPQPLWDGQTSLKDKRILLWCEQGVGDTMNWSSCLPLVASQAGHCILECQEKLVPLLSRSFPNVEVKPQNRSLDSKRDDFDFHLPMGSLYRNFISEISQNTKANAFLVPDPVRVNFWRDRLRSLGKGPYVGLSWKSANMSPKRLPNYAAVSELSPILKLPGITFINLQYTDFKEDLSKIQNELGVTVHNFDDLDHYDDLLDVAALCAALDVTVSTTSAVPFVSAGVGTLTKFASWKQSPWSNNLFNPVGPLVDKFERNTWEPWDNVFHLIADDILKLTDDWSAQCTEGDGFDQLEQRLNEVGQAHSEADTASSKAHSGQPNILDSLKLDQALRLAKNKAKEGSAEEAKRIYQDILVKFPKNKRAMGGLKGLAGERVSKVSKVQDPPQDQLQLLIYLYNQGLLQQALEQATVLLRQFPSSSVLYNIYGAVYKELGQFDASVEAYSKALTIKPNNAQFYSNMGVALQEQGKLEEAIDAYKKALAIKPDYADVYTNMGVTVQEQGKLEEAIEAYKKALTIKPNNAEAYSNMGNAFREQGKLEEAIQAYNKALAIKPDDAEAYNNMGNAFREQGKLEEAIEAFKKALSLNPDNADAYSNMGNALKDQGKLEEAIEAYKKALIIKPDNAGAPTNMGVTLQEQGKLEEAIEAYNKALVIKSDYADAHYGLGFALLNSGELKRGLDEYEWRWKANKRSSSKRHFLQPLWDGQTSLKDKRILLWCEQGVGDTMNWSSCLPIVASQAGHCILECQEKLVPLLSRSFPNVEVKPQNRSLDSERDDFDFHLPMGSLYRNFISEISQNTKANAFLVPDPVRVNFWRDRLRSLGKGPYVGLSWKSANMSPKRLPNYAAVSELSPILKLPGITFINLQYTDFKEDLSKIQNELGVTVHNFDDLDHYDDLLDVAALCAALDVTVSTTSAVPFVSAGVGTLTKFASWKQSPWSNNLFNPVGPLVDKFERNTWEPWDNVFHLIADDILKLTDDWSAQ